MALQRLLRAHTSENYLVRHCRWCFAVLEFHDDREGVITSPKDQRALYYTHVRGNAHHHEATQLAETRSCQASP